MTRGYDRLYQAIMNGPERREILPVPNEPEDVRYYVEMDADDDYFVLRQGDDRIVVSVDQWERFAMEVVQAILDIQR